MAIDEEAAPIGVFDDISEASTSPSAKVTFVDSDDPAIQHRALFNPETIAPSGSVEIGELHPIGWSAPVKQYAYTNSVDFTLELKYSAVAMLQRNFKFVHQKDAYAFFMSYLYSEAPGRAPAHLIVVFPKTLTLRCAVKSVTTSFERWDTAMNVRGYTLSVEFTEVAESFRSKGQVRRNGLQIATRDLSADQRTGIKIAGQSLNLGRKTIKDIL
jgi:hypothetical protein